MVTSAQEDLLLQTLIHFNAHPVVIETTVLEGMTIIGTLQLALRHPEFPAHAGRAVQTFIDAWQAQVADLHPDLALLTAWGNMRAHDVPLDTAKKGDEV